MAAQKDPDLTCSHRTRTYSAACVISLCKPAEWRLHHQGRKGPTGAGQGAELWSHKNLTSTGTHNLEGTSQYRDSP